MSWARHVAAAGTSGTLLADGYSCRSQAKLIDGVKLLHPVQALLAAIRASSNGEGYRGSTPHSVKTTALHPSSSQAA